MVASMRLWSVGAQTRSSCIFAYSRKPALENPRLAMAQGFDARSSNDKGLEHVSVVAPTGSPQPSKGVGSITDRQLATTIVLDSDLDRAPQELVGLIFRFLRSTAASILFHRSDWVVSTEWRTLKAAADSV